MQAVTVTAFTANTKYLTKIVGYFFFFHLYGSKAFDTGSVDEPAIVQLVHLGEGGGVHAFVVGIGDLSCAGFLAAEDGVEESRLADTGVTCEQCYFVGKDGFDGLLEILGADGVGRVTD